MSIKSTFKTKGRLSTRDQWIRRNLTSISVQAVRLAAQEKATPKKKTLAKAKVDNDSDIE
jgi:hypothetical protein